ncbi:hypothetical protein LQV63_27755 [Paenibacillus profundus]|uniref:Uncharacterized protein n=1 Tax=Paenibacillus profundus TaxID=1173085 RepID=A0ABS8YTU8_9BACL|nr:MULTISPECIES: hypothetical protein [Paenibacillus]MCE5173064.1 hypothetical protein [Paenibacillus profundus]
MMFGYIEGIPTSLKVKKVVCMAGRVPSGPFEVMSKMMTAFLPEALFPSGKNVKSC